jgi:hypothetical protein
MDGRRQRRAAAGDADLTRRRAQTASDLDQLGIYLAFGQLATRAADELDAGTAVSVRMWAAIRDALGPGPLAETAQRQMDELLG